MSALAIGVLLAQLAGVAQGAAAGARPSPDSWLLAVADRSDIRLRSVPAADPAIDLDTGLIGTLSFLGKRAAFVLGYSPTFSYLDIEGARQLALLHSGRATLSWTGRRLRLRLAVSGSAGTQSAVGFLTPLRTDNGLNAVITGTPTLPPATTIGTPPTTTPIAAGAFVPSLAIISAGTLQADVGVGYQFSRNWTGGADAFYGVAGGLDAPSRVALPPNRIGGGTAALAYRLTRRDQLATAVGVSEVYVPSTRLGAITATATESITHFFSPWTRGSAGGGLSYVYTNAGAAGSRGVSGTGDVTVIQTTPLSSGTTLSVGLAAQYAAVFNAAAGVVQNQISGSLLSTWAATRVRVSGGVNAAASVPFTAVDAARIISANLTLSYFPVELLALQLGGQAYAQLLPIFAEQNGIQVVTGQLTSAAQWVVFFAVTVSAPVLEL